jgi:hypothetical protein
MAIFDVHLGQADPVGAFAQMQKRNFHRLGLEFLRAEAAYLATHHFHQAVGQPGIKGTTGK